MSKTHKGRPSVRIRNNAPKYRPTGPKVRVEPQPENPPLTRLEKLVCNLIGISIGTTLGMYLGSLIRAGM